MRITLSRLNEMDRASFTGELGTIFEHSPWVAEQVWEHKPFQSVETLLNEMMSVVLDASEDHIVGLLHAHPDLGTRIKLGHYSAEEQRSVGLDSLTPEEYETFSVLNQTYVDRFGFPFILAVRGKTKADVLEAMTARSGNTKTAERQEALEQIRRIAGMRLTDIIED
ncbi:2-oxo-4-hydroxy-4-carboxy-5-ureidoimidazoline decarboxylase [Cohnella sp.]|uniref:2-oxo-4-hydroxy-4-carboxy-5-ureidoimidazoline decarboxylase n=1 Tax=Cohnella sp. TaxID=1883426 RepID=UPI0035644FEF